MIDIENRHDYEVFCQSHGLRQDGRIGHIEIVRKERIVQGICLRRREGQHAARMARIQGPEAPEQGLLRSYHLYGGVRS